MTTTASLHQQASTLLYQALDQPPSERQRFLAEACGANQELLAMTDAMLERIEQLDAFLDDPMALPDATPASAATVVAEPGALLGSWRVVRELQRGALGSIMLVERSQAGARQIAALKIVKVDDLSLDALARFQRERDKLATLHHPDLARLIDAGSLADGRPFFVMEYSDGVPLDQYCAELNLATQQRIALVVRVCMAIHSGHQRLVIHGDLQPANVLVDRAGVLKVIDFGVASLLDVQTGVDARFASPEQLAGRALGTGADIYALGALLAAVLTVDADPLRAELADLVRNATAADPDARYASAHELARLLEQYLDAHSEAPEPVAVPAEPAPVVEAPVSAPVAPAHVEAGAHAHVEAAAHAHVKAVAHAHVEAAAHAHVEPATLLHASAPTPDAPGAAAPAAAPRSRLGTIVTALLVAGALGTAAYRYLPGHAPTAVRPASSQSVARAAEVVKPVAVAQQSAPVSAAVAATGSAQLRDQAMEHGDFAEAVAQARKAVAEVGGSAGPEHFALARALVAAQDYPKAEDEFRLAHAVLANDDKALVEVELARAYAFHLRHHGRKAGQTVLAAKALAGGASDATRARVSLLEALIQPRGTATMAYAAAQKALPQLLNETERDGAAVTQQRAAAQAWRQVGEIGLRAQQKDSACRFLALAEKRYAALEAASQAGALDVLARAQVAGLSSVCN